MLVSLTIRDIVLIDRLHLNFDRALSVLTGETGAGKSILLDSLGLASGARADSGLVRHGCDQASVLAVFEPDQKHGVYALLKDNAIDLEDNQLLLKRVVTADGRSKAFINDQPVSAALLRTVGDSLVEVHGQHDDRGLLDPRHHRALLDAFGGYGAEQRKVADVFEEVQTLEQELAEAKARLENARADEEWLSHAVDELERLAPQEEEEEALATQRARMMAGEKLAGDLQTIHEALAEDGGVDAKVRSILRSLVRSDATSQDIVAPLTTTLDLAAEHLNEAIAILEGLQQDLDYDPYTLEKTEERLFELRAMARKHKCQVEDLPKLTKTLRADLDAMAVGDKAVAALKAKLATTEAALCDAVAVLSESRKNIAFKLDQAVSQELPPLKLEKATFRTFVEALPRGQWSKEGGDKVLFEVSTNPGAPFGPMVKIASGGELARFILALKVVLAQKSSTPVLVFDEVDRGIGGATADAVGERLMRLANNSQVLVITHSPQVAARGAAHYRISKAEVAQKGGTPQMVTTVENLSKEDRREEVARMLAGASVTDAARGAADQLLEQGHD